MNIEPINLDSLFMKMNSLDNLFDEKLNTGMKKKYSNQQKTYSMRKLKGSKWEIDRTETYFH